MSAVALCLKSFLLASVLDSCPLLLCFWNGSTQVKEHIKLSGRETLARKGWEVPKVCLLPMTTVM